MSASEKGERPYPRRPDALEPSRIVAVVTKSGGLVLVACRRARGASREVACQGPLYRASVRSMAGLPWPEPRTFPVRRGVIEFPKAGGGRRPAVPAARGEGGVREHGHASLKAAA